MIEHQLTLHPDAGYLLTQTPDGLVGKGPTITLRCSCGWFRDLEEGIPITAAYGAALQHAGEKRIKSLGGGDAHE